MMRAMPSIGVAEPPSESANATEVDRDSRTLSIVVPAYNEQDVLPEFHRRLAAVLDAMRMVAEVVYVDDGSADDTLQILHALRTTDARVAVVDLSRNFGKEIAMTAGLEAAVGDAVVIIDADLQDPPELIPQLVDWWHRGYDVVFAQRAAREGESFVKRATARWFYRAIQRMTRLRIPEDAGDFRLLSRRAVDALLAIREQHRFMKGLFAWIGFPQIAIRYDRAARFAGRTKWNYWRLWNFALEGITSFSTAPLKVATYFGLLVAAAAFAYGAFIIGLTLVKGNAVPGYPSLLTVVLFLGGIQLVAIGVLGEYVGRMFDETKGRPLYVVKGFAPSALGDAAGSAMSVRRSPAHPGPVAIES